VGALADGDRDVTFVVRCRYVANWDTPEGVGYLDAESRCTRDLRYAKTFDVEADAWTFAALSSERVPDDCWAEPRQEAGDCDPMRRIS
jgi:hypothetical protein